MQLSVGCQVCFLNFTPHRIENCAKNWESGACAARIVMDTMKSSILASLFRMYLLLPGKAKLILIGLPRHYPAYFQHPESETQEEQAIGYEASWAGVCQDRQERNVRRR